MAHEQQVVPPQLVRVRAPGGRTARLMASASVLFVCASVVAAALGPDEETTPGSVAVPSASVPAAGHVAPADTPSRTPRPSGWPRLTVFGDLPSPTTVLVRGPGRQLVDLATGRFGPVLDAGSWLDEWLQLGDGRLVCLCRSVTSLPAKVDEVTLLVRVVEPDGTTLRELPAGQWLVRHHRFVGDEPEGFGLQTAATLSRDGRSLVVARAALGQQGWQLGVDVIDLTGRLPLRSAELGLLPAADPSRPDHISAPPPELSPSGDAFVIRTGPACCGDAPARAWSARIAADGLRDVQEWPATAIPAGVSCGIGGVAGPDLYAALCYDEPSDVPFLGRFASDGTLLGRTILTIAGGPREIAFDPTRARAYLWSSMARTLSIVDLTDGRLRTTITVPLGYETSSGLDLGGMLSGWLAPRAVAKVLIEPGLALSPDGSRLYAVGVDALGGRAAPRTAGIFVFDTAARDLVARWTIDGDVNSIRLSADGIMLFAATMPVPSLEPGGRLEREATIVALDAQTGELRLVAGRLGAAPLLFVSDH